MVWERCLISFFCTYIQSFHEQLLKRIFFPIEWIWETCQNSTDYGCEVFFWTVSLIPFIDISLLMPEPCCFEHRSFITCFKVRNYESSNFRLLFQDCFCYLAPLLLSNKFDTWLFQFCKVFLLLGYF